MAVDKTPEALLMELQGLQARLAEADRVLRSLPPVQLGAQALASSQQPPTSTPLLPLQHQAQFLQTLLDALPTPVFYKTLEGVLLGCNQAFAQMLGLSQEEVVGKTVSDLAPPDLAATWRQKDQQLLAQPGSQEYEGSIVFADGLRHLVSIRQATFAGTDGWPAGLIGVVTDISERRKAEAATRLNEARLASLWRISQYSPASVQDLLDYALDEAITLTGSKIGYIYFYDDKTQQFTLNTWSKEAMQECAIVAPQTIYQLEKTGIWGEAVRQGRPIIVNNFQAPHPLKKGYPQGHVQLNKFLTVPVVSNTRIVAVVGVANKSTDYDDADIRQLTLMMDAVWKIVEHQRAEAALRDSEEKYRRLMETANDAIFIAEADTGIIVEVNQKGQDLLGLPKDKILGRHQSQLHPQEEAERYRAIFEEQCKTGGVTYDIFVVHSDGHLIPVEISAATTQVGGKRLVQGIFRDVTERQRAADKIDDLNTLLKAVKHINEALLRIKNEPELFQYACEVLVSVPYVRLAWIGLVDPGSFEIKPLAWSGVEDGYLSAIKVTWDDSPYGQGVVGTAIKTGKPASMEDIATDQRALPWRQAAHQRGYASVMALPLVYEGETLGILCVYSGKKQAFGEEEKEFLNQVAGDIAVGVRSLRLEQEVVRSLIKFQVMMLQTVEAIASMAEMRDPYTAGHQRGVTRLACALARKMGLAENRLEGLRLAGFLHDIGKLVVPVEILNKPGKLSEFEFSLIKTHAQAGYDILKNIDFPWPVAQIVLQHHERLNGSGYPQGLTGAHILLEAKILAVADVMEAMAAYRPDRPGLGVDKALEEITGNQGTLYDPQVVEACVQLFAKEGFQFSEGESGP